MKYPYEEWVIEYCARSKGRHDMMTAKEVRADVIHYLLKHIKQQEVE